MVGFLAAYLFDIVSIKKIPRIKGLVWSIAVIAVIYSTCMVCLDPVNFSLPTWATVVGWVLLPTFIFFFIYSLFINLPFRRTYVNSGVGDRLITSGMYALVRHPGVYWFILLMLALVLVSKSSLVLIASPIFILLDILLVVIQDRFFFGRMFAEYDRYRKETPMLLPNVKSISAFINSLRQAGAH